MALLNDIKEDVLRILVQEGRASGPYTVDPDHVLEDLREQMEGQKPNITDYCLFDILRRQGAFEDIKFKRCYVLYDQKRFSELKQSKA
jgi:hypothetical protein